MKRQNGPRGHVAVLALMVAVTAGCRNSDAGPGLPDTVPDTTPDTTAPAQSTTEQATTTTTLTDEQAAYNVYRQFLDTSGAIGTDFARNPDDGSLDPLTTPAYRKQILTNLVGLKANGLYLKGQTVTRLMSSSIPKENQLILKVCSRDDVDQFDRTGKQLSPPGQGTPEIRNVGLVKQGASWLVDGSLGTGAPCDV